jgi:DNA polymerase III sliding clamp (beta) subunit (PCNA family)
LITITRRLAQTLRSVFRRALGSRNSGPALCFTAAAGTLSVRAKSGDIAIEYHGPGEGNAPETLWVPFQALADWEAKKDDPVQLEKAGEGRVTGQWRDGSVPQLVEYDGTAAADADQFPAMPESFTENPSTLLKALQEAYETTDPDSIRYALGHLQLRGADGSVNATDGRQMLVESGFQFPWTDDLLVPANKVFAAAQFSHEDPVGVARAGNWVAFRSGPWTVWLGINADGRFPDLSRHAPDPEAAVNRCRFSAADARFLGETLPRLPCDEEYNYRITLDLNGQIAIRARATDQSRLTEVVLSNSESSGEPIRLNINRQYLARAVKFGFQELLLYGDTAALVCRDASRLYVWMPLDPESALKPAEDAIRIVSPAEGQETSATTTTITRKRRTPPVSEPTTNRNGDTEAQPQTNGRAKTNGQANGQARKPATRKSQQQDLAGLIEQGEALRAALRETLVKTNELLKGLKHHRRASRTLESTLASLRQLKTLGV